MMTSYILQKLDEFIREQYQEPKACGRKQEDRTLLASQSYRRWAVEEIRVYILIHDDIGPREAVENFRCMMDDYACRAKTGEANFIFSTAYDTATDVLDMLLSIE